MVSWNVQGLGWKETRDHLKDIARLHDPDISFLVETKCAESKEKVITQFLQYPNSHFVSSIGMSGGLAVLWKDGFPCDIICSKDNMVHIIITTDASKQECLLSYVYGSTQWELKKQQWEFLEDLSENIFQSWIVLGDLNVHVSKEDASTSLASLDNWICQIINNAGLMDLGFTGSKHTWTNKTNEKGHKRARIDLDLLNSNWIRDYPDSRLLHLPFLGSDHCPLLLLTESKSVKHRNVWKFRDVGLWIKMLWVLLLVRGTNLLI
ncbi:DNA-(apurinic or apyrimidinic site) lyase-like [Papaver somniferum]|uniref:DNA-(apurinic or apyrimidinic site) lyase-like n=1 Tax=Papaver somniferum TaxID=3469 RepID=UPI000E6F48C9|nr:DNA-(apurinic or apyrimidinic site) lyase-like [Papaver somniferum]